MKRFKSERAYRVLMFILSVFIIILPGCDGGGHSNKSVSTIPTVSSTLPSNLAIGVPINSQVTVIFSQAMNAATITPTTFTLKHGATVVSGAVHSSGVTAVFTPTSELAPLTAYTATITTGAKNLAGNALASDYVWSFTTGVTTDTTIPTVTLTVPADVAVGVSTNTKITATFSEDMDPLSITGTTFTLKQGATAVPGTVTYAVGSRTAIFTPTSSLLGTTVYTATITTGAEDLAGNALASNFVWSFTTGAGPDTTLPTVTLLNPANHATLVCTNKTIAATFSEAMDPQTINRNTFTLAAGVTSVAGIVAYDPLTRIATFNPTADLAGSTLYTATIKGGATGVKDLAGNALAANKVWTFTTGTATCTPAPVALGAAATFAGAIGGSGGMTNQGILTVVNGDIGTTAASTLITGFHDSTGDVYTETTLNIGAVNGRIYTAAPPPGGAGVGGTAATLAIATQAEADAQIAYDSISPASLPGGLAVETCVGCGGGDAGELGGRTLAPGVYLSTPGTYGIGEAAHAATSPGERDLTLDAQGDPNAVWVFQAPGGLTVGLTGPAAPLFPISVNLINGAQAKNVFWYVPAGATIGTGSTMVGTMISTAAITFSTAGTPPITTLNGRALSLVAGVTVVNTHINVPAP